MCTHESAAKSDQIFLLLTRGSPHRPGGSHRVASSHVATGSWQRGGQHVPPVTRIFLFWDNLFYSHPIAVLFTSKGKGSGVNRKKKKMERDPVTVPGCINPSRAPGPRPIVRQEAFVSPAFIRIRSLDKKGRREGWREKGKGGNHIPRRRCGREWWGKGGRECSWESTRSGGRLGRETLGR